MSEEDDNEPILDVVFYKSEAGNEPVRGWLKSLPRDDCRIIGEDIKTAQYGWPLGMPLIRKMERGLWEVCSNISTGIARVIFTVKQRCGDDSPAWVCEEIAENAAK